MELVWASAAMFAGVVGLGALLLFQVQLVLGKQLLPWFGGASAVWTTCLLFFQAALLAGYAWAHFLADRLSPRRQRDAHLALLGAALALLLWRALAWPSPITPGERRRSRRRPTRRSWRSSACSASTIGLPFVALAATSPLLQAWFARLRPGRSPFWLFALSNAGSLARARWATRSSSSRGLREDAGLAVVGGVRGLRGRRRVVRGAGCHPEGLRVRPVAEGSAVAGGSSSPGRDARSG